MARVEVFTGPERRRRWREERKRAIVAASFAPRAVVSEVARRAAISAGQIYRWRQELRAAAPGFAPVLIAPPTAAAGISANTVKDEQRAEATIEVEFAAAGKVRVRIAGLVPAELAAAVLKVLALR
jgi:transposase